MKALQGGVPGTRRVGPYLLEEPLGHGGMGTVWRAWDERLKRQVAVKQIRADATISYARERLRREAQATARLNHPAIVHIYDILELDDGDWMVMELVAGRTLRGVLDQEGPLPPFQVVQLGREIAEGLAQAHGYGILHRDLKASNIMVLPSGRAKILDFGVAKQLAGEGEGALSELTLSQPGTVLGTCYAMAPEQALGRTLDPRADLFSLGSLLYESLTGEPPFWAETPMACLARVLSFRPQSLHTVIPALSPELSDLVDCLLEKDPRDRPQSARQVAESLAGIAAATPSEGNGRPVVSAAARETSSQASQEFTLLTVDQRPPAAPARGPTSSTARRRRMGEHRPVTVVCCGLVGVDESSGEASPIDLEVLSEVMAAFQDLAGEACRRHSGQLGAVLGNQVWLYFGYPEAHEDDVERAVRAAREIAAGTEELGLRFGSAEGWKLALRSAVHTGPAMVATREGLDEHLQLGATLELATGLQSAAPVGTIVASAESRRLIDRGFATEALPAVRMAGCEQPVILYRVLGPRDAQERESGELGTLVGRQRELEILVDRFRLACSGTGQAVLIGGEPGIGKSRLVRALRERLAAEDPAWLVAYGSAHTQSSPLAPMVDLLERTVFATGESGARRDIARLEAFLARHGDPLPETVPLLASLLSLPSEDRFPPLSLSPDAQRKKTFEALLALFEEMAERRPVVLVVEDLHWVDPSTLELLDLLLHQIDGLPLLLIATFRPEFQAPWGHRAQLTQLGLNRLEEPEIETLIDRLTAGKALPTAVQRQILVRTDGVPLFVEELTRAVLEAGPEGGQAEIPSTLSGSLAARLDRLGEAKEVAQIASVIGRTFSFDLLQAISPPDPAALQEGLEKLVRSDLVHRRGAGPRARYSFRHALIQDAAYASLLRRDRHQLHLKIAQRLEEQLSEPDRAQPAGEIGRGGGEALILLLAHHWSQAMDLRRPDPVSIRRAVAHLIAAGEYTLGLSAYQEAHAHLDVALSLVRVLPEGADCDEQELIVQTRMSTVLKATQGWISPDVRDTYDRARDLCLKLGNRSELPEISFGLWSFHLASGAYGKSLSMAEECYSRARESEAFDLQMARCALSNSLFWLCRLPESLYHAEKVLGLSAEGDHEAYRVNYGQDPRILAAQFAVWSLWHLGREADAFAWNENAIELADRLAHPFSMAIALTTATNFHRNRRDPAMALRTAEKLIEVSKKLGFPSYELSGRIARCWALAGTGHAADVVDEVVKSFESYFTVWGEIAYALCCCLVTEVLWRAGRCEEALAVIDSGLAMAGKNGELAHESELYCLKGEFLLELASRGNGSAESCRQEAEQALKRSFDLACQRLQVPFAERAAGSLVPLLMAEGSADEAEEIRQAAGELAGRVSARVQEVHAELAE